MRKIILASFLLLPGLCSIASSPIRIDTTETVRIGGIKQFMSIKGRDNTKPVLLYLHGGPGESVMDSADKFTSKLQNDFVVVQWDQRETGKTLELGSSPAPVSVSLMQQDTKEVIDYLLKKFGQKKIYLVGHSWGTVLGFYVADKYPQLLNAFVAISPIIKNTDSIWFEKVVAFEKEKGNDRALKELATVRIPFQDFEQMFTARKWLSDYEGDPVPDSMVVVYKKMLEPWKNRWFPVSSEVNSIDLYKSLPSVKCPVYFFVGRNDNQTPHSVSEDYYNKLKAPGKELFWFEKSGHLIPNTQPDLMQEIILKKILPATSEK